MDIVEISENLAEEYNLSIKTLKGSRRDKKIVNTRKKLTKLLHDEYEVSFGMISRLLNKDYTTIKHYYNT